MRKQKRPTQEHIIMKLCEAEVLIGKGHTIVEDARKLSKL